MQFEEDVISGMKTAAEICITSHDTQSYSIMTF